MYDDYALTCDSFRADTALFGRRGVGRGVSARLRFLFAVGPESLRVGIDEAVPAFAMERLPMALWLAESVGDGVKRPRMRAKAEVARFDDDVLCKRPPGLDAAPPSHDAVGRAEDRCCRRREIGPERHVKIVSVDAMAADELVDPPGVGFARMAGEWRAERYDEAHHLGRELGELAGGHCQGK